MSALSKAISCSSSGGNTIVAAVSNYIIRVLDWDLVVAAAVTVQWQDGASNNLTGAYSFAANGGISVPQPGTNARFLFAAAAGQALILNLGGAVAVAGRLNYELVPA